MTRRVFLPCLVALGLVSFFPGAQSAAFGAVRGDFNGDGNADLAVGVRGEGVGTGGGAGAVNVLYGSAAGLSATGNQFWNQNSSGILDSAEANDAFGSALATGDFNGDGFDDLAVGVPGEDVGGRFAAGAVNVLYGSAAGLSATGNQFWNQNSSGILDSAEANDAFGSALAAGDLNGDGRDDLAVGVPGEALGSGAYAGAINVLFGGAGGLSATGNQFWNQDSPGVLDDAEGGDRFGSALAAGDLNGNGRDDLAVGAPAENVGNVRATGAVNVLIGRAGGLSATGDQFWDQNSPSVLDTAEQNDTFGTALATGDLNGDGRDDLAVGAPGEGIASRKEAGAVNVLYGAAGGVSATGNQLWHQNSPGVLDTANPIDKFGGALAAGDLNGDGRVDLAVGVNGENVGTVVDAGAVNVLYGSAGGLSATGNQFWSQDSPGILDAAEQNDAFGLALVADDLNGDGRDDLTVGVYRESIGSVVDAGAVNVLYGDPGGLSATGTQFWNQDSPGVLDAAEASDYFGHHLAAGDGLL